MKVPPKRKGNIILPIPTRIQLTPLNESPSEKEGKFCREHYRHSALEPSMKVPPKRKGNISTHRHLNKVASPSMKVPPKRKGNLGRFGANILSGVPQ